MSSEFFSNGLHERLLDSDGKYNYLETLRTKGGLKHLVTNITRHVRKLLQDRLTPENVEAAIVAAETFYDSVLAPIDLSLIPNLVEGYFDKAVRLTIRPSIMFVADELRAGPTG